MFWMLPALGATAGALMSKKPLQGALMGGALGATNGVLGGGLPAIMGPAAGIGGGLGAAGGVNPGLLDQAMGGMRSLSGYMKPIGEAAQTVGQVQGLLGQQQQAPMPQMPMGRQGADPIGQMLQGQMQLEQQRRGSWQGGMNGGLFEELRRKYGM